MSYHELLGYFFGVLVGITLGLIGSGGSILSVPILVYVMGVEPILATAYSLFIVGTTALVGGIQKAKEELVDFKKVMLFGIPTVCTVYFTRKFIVPSLPDILFSTGNFIFTKQVFIMLVFAIVMIGAAFRMIKPIQNPTVTIEKPLHYTAIFVLGVTIGLVAGFVGAGGGFLLIPALLFFANTPMKIAVGTSLFIVAAQSLLGFLGDIRPEQTLDWRMILVFTGCSIVGVFIGSILSKKIDGERLKIAFGWFVFAMGLYIISKEVWFK